MKIFLIDWSSYGKEDIKSAIIAEGHDLVCFPFAVSDHSLPMIYEKFINNQNVEEGMCQALRKDVPDVVFSTNYFPVISKVCQKEHIRYVSWNYDSPSMMFYSPSITNSCNIIYTFDKEECRKYRNAGVSNMYYLPLAANIDRLDSMMPNGSFAHDISFVGTLYVWGDGYFDYLESHLPDYAKGFLKAMIAVQLKLQGYNLISEMLPFIIDDLDKAYPVVIQSEISASSKDFYENSMIFPRINAIERMNLLEAISQKYTLDFFTNMKSIVLGKTRIHGAVDYYSEMPLVLKKSKINLNISSRRIQSGIPLRAFDIMGAGGFLLSNFQADFIDYFVPGEDFIYYESCEDLINKIGYYLAHEEERMAIAKNGHDKVAKGHTYRHRIREIFDSLS